MISKRGNVQSSECEVRIGNTKLYHRSHTQGFFSLIIWCREGKKTQIIRSKWVSWGWGRGKWVSWGWGRGKLVSWGCRSNFTIDSIVLQKLELIGRQRVSYELCIHNTHTHTHTKNHTNIHTRQTEAKTQHTHRHTHISWTIIHIHKETEAKTHTTHTHTHARVHAHTRGGNILRYSAPHDSTIRF